MPGRREKLISFCAWKKIADFFKENFERYPCIHYGGKLKLKLKPVEKNNKR